MERWLKVALVFAFVFSGGYAAWKIGSRARDNAEALVRFSHEVRRTAEEQNWRYEVTGGREEGLLLYLRRDHFLSPNDAVEQWKTGALDALVVPSRPSPPWVATLPGAREFLISEKSRVIPGYSLLVRSP